MFLSTNSLCRRAKTHICNSLKALIESNEFSEYNLNFPQMLQQRTKQRKFVMKHETHIHLICANEYMQHVNSADLFICLLTKALQKLK